MTNATEIPSRDQWLRLWSALPAASVKALASDLAGQHQVQDLALPQSGLGLLPITDSALGDTYFIGEIPLAQAHVRVTTTHGQSVEGAAILVDDRAGVARAMAILDAVLAARIPGCEAATELLDQGAAALAEQSHQRRSLLVATRVNFALLGTNEEDDDE
ncbi:phosphonate C-P lyase system protein PhnG [Hydrogenophaga sp.]|uniref:phosphonate C-P lyase system protein PhnG n=1 Tax=Hydrogenophaga sp. TaxID=1904254 RepID=UPI0027332BF3|nr:phosphonate C-P lyase system protein PhnG [Hydrogenophaga sp.]MDP3887475.1 phosphonate C-P lyase system protein PhnG [Hydrogenophaga sp.]